MIQLADLRVFLEINATGSFSEAARRLRMPKSSVARQIERLETTLGAALFARTSRTVALTDEGRAFLPHARRLYDDGVETEHVLKNGNRGASGKLTVSATAPFARHFLVPHLPAFLDGHPDVQVALWLTQARVEVGSGEDQVDIAIRLRSSAGPDLANRKLGEIDFLVVASPAYLAANGAPERPDDLKYHQLIELGPLNKAHQVELRRGKETATIRYTPRLQIDDPDAIRLAAWRWHRRGAALCGGAGGGRRQADASVTGLGTSSYPRESALSHRHCAPWPGSRLCGLPDGYGFAQRR